jgi:hypothetical protein
VANVISQQAELQLRAILRPWLVSRLQRLFATQPHRPFHEALLPGRDLSLWGEERSFSTVLGTRFQAMALVLARNVHGNGTSNHTVTGQVPTSTISTISAIVDDLRRGRQRIDTRFPELVRLATSGYSGDMVTRSALMDLSYTDAEGVEHYFEIKSPKPNRGQCVEATQLLLLVYAIRAANRDNVRAYYAMPYNPYGEDKTLYAWQHAKGLLDLQHEVLLGQEFWDYVGGPGTYAELLRICGTVGQEVAASVEESVDY